MNIVDLLAILPYYISLVFYRWLQSAKSNLPTTTLPPVSFSLGLPMVKPEVGDKGGSSTDEEVRRIAQFFRLIRIVKMFRIIRIFKLARHSGALKALGKTIKNCYKELGMLTLFLSMGVLIFSSLIYTFEHDDPDQDTMETMLDAYWWALITMTTVGYGEVVPITGLGRLVGAVCAIFGILVIALPIPIIGNQFSRYYQREQRKTKLLQRMEAAAGQVNAIRR